MKLYFLLLSLFVLTLNKKSLALPFLPPQAPFTFNFVPIPPSVDSGPVPGIADSLPDLPGLLAQTQSSFGNVISSQNTFFARLKQNADLMSEVNKLLKEIEDTPNADIYLKEAAAELTSARADLQYKILQICSYSMNIVAYFMSAASYIVEMEPTSAKMAKQYSLTQEAMHKPQRLDEQLVGTREMVWRNITTTYPYVDYTAYSNIYDSDASWFPSQPQEQELGHTETITYLTFVSNTYKKTTLQKINHKRSKHTHSYRVLSHYYDKDGRFTFQTEDANGNCMPDLFNYRQLNNVTLKDLSSGMIFLLI